MLRWMSGRDAGSMWMTSAPKSPSRWAVTDGAQTVPRWITRIRLKARVGGDCAKYVSRGDPLSGRGWGAWGPARARSEDPLSVESQQLGRVAGRAVAEPGRVVFTEVGAPRERQWRRLA